MYSGELAQLVGVSTDTLRYYERQGLLPRVPRSTAGYRLYSTEARTRVRVIRGALSIGFSVAQLRAIFAERDRGGVPCKRVRVLAAEKLQALEGWLRDSHSWRRELKATLAGWDRLLRKTPRGERAGLLEALVTTHPTRQRRRPHLTALARGNKRRERCRMTKSLVKMHHLPLVSYFPK